MPSFVCKQEGIHMACVKVQVPGIALEVSDSILRERPDSHRCLPFGSESVVRQHLEAVNTMKNIRVILWLSFPPNRISGPNDREGRPIPSNRERADVPQFLEAPQSAADAGHTPSRRQFSNRTGLVRRQPGFVTGNSRKKVGEAYWLPLECKSEETPRAHMISTHSCVEIGVAYLILGSRVTCLTSGPSVGAGPDPSPTPGATRFTAPESLS